MLTISRRQLATLDEHARQRFACEMADHFRTFAPNHAAAIGDSAIREVALLGIARASAYGWTLRGPVRLYLELMVMFGSDFDTDPMLPWAGCRLREASPAGEMERASALAVVATTYHRAVYGRDHIFEAEALRRLGATSRNDWLIPRTRDETWAQLRAIFPQKCDYAGRHNFQSLLMAAQDAAIAHGLEDRAASGVLCGLMLALGRGCLTDMQFPWLAGNLAKTTGLPGADRLARLIGCCLAFFETAGATLAGRLMHD